MATELIECRGDVGIGMGIDPERDEHLGFWHGRHGRLLSFAWLADGTHRSETADRTATGLAVTHL
jgi:hypothetical protein